MVYGLQVSPRFSATGAPSLCGRILGMICTLFCGSPQRSSWLCFLRMCSFQLENVSCGITCSCSRVGKTSLFVASTLCIFGLCAPQVSVSCHSAVFRDSVDSFVDQVGLALCLCLTDKYLWEHIPIHLDRDASGLDQAGQWYCRRWYTWYDGQPGINRKICRTFGVWVLEKCASFTMTECSLLVEVRDLVHGMFCKRHSGLGNFPFSP